MMKQTNSMTDEIYNLHRMVATQTSRIYMEINKLATKKPSERLTPLISTKINHLIAKTKVLVRQDEFLDAIDTIPTNGELIRLDEALIILSELTGVLDRQWESAAFREYRRKNSIHEYQTINAH